jgi:hypothetical protein
VFAAAAAIVTSAGVQFRGAGCPLLSLMRSRSRTCLGSLSLLLLFSNLYSFFFEFSLLS